MRETELLIPAGSLDVLKTAVSMEQMPYTSAEKYLASGPKRIIFPKKK